MPAKERVPAKFGPIPPDLDLRRLVEETPNFKWVDRISCSAIDEQGVDAFEKTVDYHVIRKGLPLVVDGWQNKLETWIFSPQWLKDNHGTKFEQGRNLTKQENLPLSIAHYLNNMSVLSDQWNHANYKDANRQRLYLKDIDCPDLWQEKLKEQIPGAVFYLNESTGEVGGPGSKDEQNPNGIGSRKGRGAAHAGDLMSCLPTGMRAENLMCYIGHEGTYTPAHREMCASLGQNIMVETSGALDENGKRTKPGSSIWFMTETKDRQVVSEYWLSTLGHDIEVEKHFAHINAWRKAPFTVYVVEQKAGDMILIPPLAPHQVWNRGTRTMKVAWNRTTVDTLIFAMNEALPRARLVCRDEQYKNKSIVLFTLNKYSGILGFVEQQKREASSEAAKLALITAPKMKQLKKDFKRLFKIFTSVLISESFSLDLPNEKKVEYLPYDSNVTCSYCRANIFNRFLTCRSCVVPLDDGSEDTYDICLECYIMGRSCRCISKLEWIEQFPWKDLLEKHEQWRKLYIELDGGLKETSPSQFATERRFAQHRTAAEICQFELKKRPYKDPRKPEPESEPSDDSDDADVTASGAPKKTGKKEKRSEKWKAENLPCHFCCWRHPKWKEAVCTTCGAAFCYGTLWRGFDQMPGQILERKTWDCPRCLKICTCASCRKDRTNIPFEPQGTILGHDTREFADPRSVESLVDFSVSNRHWIKKSGDGDLPEENRRLQRRQSQAMKDKEAPSDTEDEDAHQYLDEEMEPGLDPSAGGVDNDVQSTSSDDDIPIDPALTGGTADWSRIASKFSAKTQASEALSALGDLARQDPEAFEALGGLSRLEQDPEGFVSQAGLERDESPLFVAPAAVMRGNEDGIDSSTMNGSSKKNKKRSRKSVAPKVVSDAPPVEPDPFAQSTTPSAANQRFQLQVEKKRMGEAKKAKHLIAARAAMKGLTAKVTLKLSRDKLVRFPTGSSRNAQPAVIASEGNGSATSVPIVESNLPPAAPESEATMRNAKTIKKRVREEDIDEDFAAVPSRDRRTQKQVRESRRTAIEDRIVHEISDDDGESDNSSEGHYKTPPSHPPSGSANVSKRRSLPSYLAQRQADPDAPLPKELLSEARSRPKSRPKPSQSSILASLAQRSPSQDQDADLDTDQVQEDNRQAKLAGADGVVLDQDASDTDPDRDEKPGSASPPPRTKKPRVEASPATTPAKKAMAMRGGPASRGMRGGRGSIFAARGRGNIKIRGMKRT